MQHIWFIALFHADDLKEEIFLRDYARPSARTCIRFLSHECCRPVRIVSCMDMECAPVLCMQHAALAVRCRADVAVSECRARSLLRCADTAVCARGRALAACSCGCPSRPSWQTVSCVCTAVRVWPWLFHVPLDLHGTKEKHMVLQAYHLIADGTNAIHSTCDPHINVYIMLSASAP